MTTMTPEQGAAALRRMQVAIHAALQRDIATLAQRVAVRMKLEAPKFQTTLTNSVEAHAETADGMTWFIGPHVSYARWVAGGRKPGKGLPSFDGPNSAAARAWLLAHPRAAAATGAGSVRRRLAADAELRTRYLLWSRKVKAVGIKADPFVDRTRVAMAPVVTDGLAAAVRRGVQAAKGAA